MPLVNRLASDYSAGTFAKAGLLYTATWWAWATEAYFKNLYDPDDGLARLFMLIQVGGLTGMGAAVIEAA